MNKVITINLNGNAYQVEEAGYTALSAYLAQAEAKLETNPDKEEIMRDFEQAVAEKFRSYLSPSKTVVTADEVQKIIVAMGPVVGGEETKESAPGGTAGNAKGPRRLYRVREGSIIMGVCSGIAAYFDVDVAIIRIAFIVLTFITSGGFILAYFLMGVFLPYASTVDTASAARAAPFSAHEFIQQAQANYGQFRGRKEWKQWKRAMRHGGQWDNSVPAQPAAPYLFPFINLAKVFVLLAFIYVFVAVVAHRAVFGVLLPYHAPIWLALIALFILYRFVTIPLQWAKYRAYYPLTGTSSKEYAPNVSWMIWHAVSSIIGFAAVIFVAWLAYVHIPGVHAALDSAGIAIQNAFTR